MKDTKLELLIKKEVKRQQQTIDLIPSENFPSPDILRIVGSPLMNKYSEGYPGKRYYPGNEYYDEIENMARERALKLFNLDSNEWGVNVQPYSGSPANMAVYLALLELGDTVMGMSLASGGHLTHGHTVNFSGLEYCSVPYLVDAQTCLLDYKAIEALAQKEKPKLVISGFTAYSRILDFKKFGAIARSVQAYHLADISHIAGLVAAGAHPSPFPHADIVTMTTHKTLRGPRGAMIFARKKPSEGKGGEKPLNELIDRAVFPGLQGGPHDNTTAAIALMCREAMQPAFRTYAQRIVANAKALSAALQKEGFSIVTGGTDNHLLLLDTRGTGLTGMEAQDALEKNNILANRNSLPWDDKPFRPSGLRLGTPAMTSRGFREPQMRAIASFFRRVLIDKENVKKEVATLCAKYPLPYRF